MAVWRQQPSFSFWRSGCVLSGRPIRTDHHRHDSLWDGQWIPDPVRIHHHTDARLGALVRLLAQALDPSGAVVGQRIAWVPGGVSGFGRAYFEIPHLPATDHYRVSVWDFSFIESASLT